MMLPGEAPTRIPCLLDSRAIRSAPPVAQVDDQGRRSGEFAHGSIGFGREFFLRVEVGKLELADVSVETLDPVDRWLPISGTTRTRVRRSATSAPWSSKTRCD